MVDRVKFTKTAIASLPLPSQGTRATYYDTETPRLALRVTAAGTRTYYVIKRAGNEMAWVKLGTHPDMTPEKARKEADKVLGEFAGGANPARVRREHKAEMTLEELFNRYMEEHGDTRAHPYKLRDLYRLYLSHWAKRKLAQIHYQDVVRWHRAIPDKINQRRAKEAERVAALKAKGQPVGRGVRTTPVSGHRTANTALALLHAMFQRAIDKRWWKGENPAHGVDRFKEASRERFLRADEMPKFFEALAQEPNPDVRDYFLLSLLTGARRSKVLAMRWQDISLDRAEWRIPQEANEKNVAMVPLMPEALAILEARKQAGAVFVFPGSGKSGHLVEPKKGWERVLDRAGLSDLRIHDLRRTLGSWQARSGASLAIIGKSLGHKSQQATAIYARLDLDPVRQAMETATSAMLEAGGLKKPAEVVKIRRTT